MERIPALFIGHGSPMNAIEDNRFSRQWMRLGERLPTPKAILSVSAHWFTTGTLVNNHPAPQMIYDMYGFPQALYQVVYGAPGAPEWAARTRELLGAAVRFDNSWGLDHGSWSVLRRLFPQADVPVFQLSVDAGASPQAHFDMGKKLRPLREQGVMVLGSGNIVHNLGMIGWDMDGGYPWADAFDAYMQTHILQRDFGSVLRYREAGESAQLAVPTIDHFAPLLYVLGASADSDRITVWNDARTMGAMSMTSYLFA